jgi:hypothetical protein
MSSLTNKSGEDQYEYIKPDDVPDVSEYSRISSHHFTIRLMTEQEKQILSYTKDCVPAIIICQGKHVKHECSRNCN